MKASQQNIKLLAVLNQWQNFEGVYNPLLHDMEIYEVFEEFEYLNNWFHFDFESNEKDRFLQFATDCTGGVYMLWITDNIPDEAPVVFLGSEGQTNLLASSLTDFVCLLTQGKLLNAEDTDDDRTPRDFWQEPWKWQWDDMAKDNHTSVKKIKERFAESLAIFKKLVQKNVDCKDKNQIFEAIEQLPNFSKWVEDILNKYQDYKEYKNPNELNLSYKELNEIPKSILNNLSIKKLDISGNNIKKIPEFITQLTHLEELDLSGNEIAEIPEFIGQLKQLKIIYFNNNQITTIPNSFGNLVDLEKLFLQENNILDLPKSLENLKNLEKLELNNNGLEALKLDFTKLEKLAFLYLYENDDFNYIDPSIYQSKSLMSIDYEDTLLEKKLSHIDFVFQSISQNVLDDVVSLADEILDETTTIPIELIPKFIAIHQKRIDLYPSAETYKDFAHFYQYTIKKDFEKAIPLYEKCIEFKENDDFGASIYTDFAKLYYYNLKTNFDKAEQLFKEAIQEDELCAYALEQYASFLKFHKKEYKAVATLYKKLIKANPSDVLYYKNLADVYELYLKNPKKAAKIYQKLIDLKPEKNKYQKKYAELLAFDLYKYKKALKIFKKILKNKKSADNYYNYIIALKGIDADKELIKKTIEKAIKKHPKDEFLIQEHKEFLLGNNDFSEIETAINKGTAPEVEYVPFIQKLVENKQFDKADKIIEIGLKNYPNSDMILLFKLHLLINKSADNEEIIKLSKKIKEISTTPEISKKCDLIINSRTQNLEDLSAYDDLIASKNGDIKALMIESGNGFAEQDFKKVTACLKAAEKIDAYHPDMLTMFSSVLHFTQGADAGTDFLLEKIKTGESVHPSIVLIEQLLKANKFEEAKKHYLSAKEKFPNDEDILYLKEQFEATEITANSEAEFEALLLDNPDDLAINTQYAFFLFDAKKYKKAIKQYEKVILLDKDEVANYLDVSQAYYLLGNSKKEEEYRLKALQIAPMEFLNHILKMERSNFDKYAKIVKESFPENKEIHQYVDTISKML